MPNRPLVLLALTLAAIPSGALAAKTKSTDLDQQLRCAAVFAVLARDQMTKQPGADAYPAMEGPGRAFFVMTGQRLFAERKLDEVSVGALFKTEAGKFQQEIAEAKDPKAHFDAAFRSCQHYLSEIAPVPAN